MKKRSSFLSIHLLLVSWLHAMLAVSWVISNNRQVFIVVCNELTFFFLYLCSYVANKCTCHEKIMLMFYSLDLVK